MSKRRFFPAAAFLALCLLSGVACNFTLTPALFQGLPATPTPLVLPTTPSPAQSAPVLQTAPTVPAPAVAVVAEVRTSTATPAIPTLVPSPTLRSTTTPIAEPAGCQRPPDGPDAYKRVTANGSYLNARTLAMLKHAQTLYKGPLDFTGWGITQGSYNPGGVTASFGTHDGGGAVDLSVLNPRTGQPLLDEVPAAIRALRIAGFAAWLRERNELYPGSPVHIHAIAIGDTDLSPAARDQLTGPFGYFRGYNGLPQTDNVPIPDRHGGPVFCQWMLDMGYRDLRQG